MCCAFGGMWRAGSKQLPRAVAAGGHTLRWRASAPEERYLHCFTDSSFNLAHGFFGRFMTGHVGVAAARSGFGL